ncbi:hypothetical protein DICPUDRAFT_153392 [Dictyostelium purpureum]|uniref:EGF-like domain-containing protein n=1 Tax=Dictyostelium purpureum TaxID=5786 RepID=F0ZNS7_DICPU|nr:uncharacterized protein DICPUDRAFT_153392 [Dictyostelium purpureum]EGC34405.1 hypothetical protein DICPUDRAFT_153392 [Dictyostelium purpureum]|eukprot:XP_003289079.1 hypothetical protein DICPUDRAFT_153392 [Dictyostelium purpureum]
MTIIKHLIITLLFLNYFVIISNTYIIRDITPLGNYNKENIQYALNGKCSFKKLILCVPEETEECDKLTLNIQNVFTGILYSNSSAYIHSVLVDGIGVGTQEIIINTKSTYSLECRDLNNVIEVSNFGYSPSNYQLQNLKLPGYNQGVLISFDTNTVEYDSFLLFKLDGSEITTFSYPIYGDLNQTTFLVPMGNFDAVAPTEIYSQNKDSLNLVNSINSPIINQYYFDPNAQIEDDGFLNNTIEDKPIVSVEFSGKSKYLLTNFIIRLSEYASFSKPFPYGFVGGNSNSFVYRIGFLVFYKDIAPRIIFIKSDLNIPGQVLRSYDNINENIGDDSKPPIIYSIEKLHIISNLYKYTIKAEIPNGFFNFRGGSTSLGAETLVSGTFENGIFEFVASPNIFPINIYDNIGLNLEISDSMVVNINPIEIFEVPLSDNIDIYSIQNVSFLYNDINVTDTRVYNVLYFSYNSLVPKDTVFVLVPLGGVIQDVANPINSSNENMFYSSYNYQKNSFEIEFYIEENSQVEMDLRGPVIKSFKSFGPNIDSVKTTDYIVYSFSVSDPINGFSNGYFTVRGDSDLSTYNLTFTIKDVLPGGDNYLGNYELKFKVSYPCISQDFVITEAALYDTMNKKSFFSIFSSSGIYSSVMNPFADLLNPDTAFNVIRASCVADPDAITDTKPPVLVTFQPSTLLIDTSKASRELTIKFSASDEESGIKDNQYPIVYLTTAGNIVTECKSNIILITPIVDTPFGNTIDYSCTIQLPLGFAYPTGFALSVYGLINNNGYHSGYSSNDLSYHSFPYFVETSFSTNDPNLESYHRVSEKGGDLWIFGRGFSEPLKAHIQFNDGSTQEIQASTIHPTAIKLSNVAATSTPYELYITSNSIVSNTIIIAPTFFGYTPEDESSAETPTETPIPTNKPQQCLGKPQCGGPSHGICIENQGCVCYSPWFGNDCSSQIIIVDPPKSNDSSPSTNITLPGNNVTATYKSLITLVSIREINIFGDVLYEKPFEKWILKQEDETTFIYTTTLDIKKSSNKTGTTDIKATLKWFVNETTISFANEKFNISKSSMKYTIDIGEYPFENTLNQLELVMSAQIESNTNDTICSVREFGETTSGDNSNYVKIQVDDHSLYGRFIKRGIIDSYIKAISNVLLDKDMKPISTTKSLQSFIGIQIPNFKQSVVLDPDFSILLDSNSASSKSGSICPSSKLSAGKIAGIAIGCTAFVTVISISIIYSIIKKRNNKKFISSINNKMNEMNNDKL